MDPGERRFKNWWAEVVEKESHLEGRERERDCSGEEVERYHF